MGNLSSSTEEGSDPHNPHPELSILTSRKIPHSSVVTGLMAAVSTNSVVLLKMLLVTTGACPNIVDREGNPLLHVAIMNKSLAVFKYLVKRDDVNKNAINSQEASALVVAALSGELYYVKKLLKKGAIVNVTDVTGSSPLHYAVRFGSPEMCEILIKAGSDINAQNSAGKTPIVIACQYGKTEKIHMLLYYQGNVSIPCSDGTIPLLVGKFSSFDLDLKLILYSYTFDDLGCTMELKTIVRAMVIKWVPFPFMLSKVSNITYDKYDLQLLNDALVEVRSDHFKLFLDKFDYVVKDMLRHCCTLTNYLITVESMKSVTPEVIDFLYSYPFLKTDLIHELVQSCCTSASPVSSLVKIFHKSNLPLTDLTKLVCYFLSYGLRVTPSDLNAVYHFHGRCELFEILLHMEIESPEDFVPCCGLYDHEVIQKSIMPYFIYDVKLNIDTFLQNPKSYLLMDLDVLLDYFAVPKLKEFFLEDGPASKKIIQKIDKLPTVPSLVELSRNVARDYMIHRLSLRSSSQFYTALKCLPINTIYKKIISYDKKLYGY